MAAQEQAKTIGQVRQAKAKAIDDSIFDPNKVSSESIPTPQSSSVNQVPQEKPIPNLPLAQPVQLSLPQAEPVTQQEFQIKSEQPIIEQKPIEPPKPITALELGYRTLALFQEIKRDQRALNFKIAILDKIYGIEVK